MFYRHTAEGKVFLSLSQMHENTIFFTNCNTLIQLGPQETLKES